MPPLRFHDLRHTAGSLLVRALDPVTVRDILGHASIHTTERYLHARRAAGLADAATAAFDLETVAVTNARREQLLSMIESLGEDEVTRLLEGGRSATGPEAT